MDTAALSDWFKANDPDVCWKVGGVNSGFMSYAGHTARADVMWSRTFCLMFIIWLCVDMVCAASH